MLQKTTGEKFFSFTVRTEFTDSHHRFDQCGVVLYLNSENWLIGMIRNNWVVGGRDHSKELVSIIFLYHKKYRLSLAGRFVH